MLSGKNQKVLLAIITSTISALVITHVWIGTKYGIEANDFLEYLFYALIPLSIIWTYYSIHSRKKFISYLATNGNRTKGIVTEVIKTTRLLSGLFGNNELIISYDFFDKQNQRLSGNSTFYQSTLIKYGIHTPKVGEEIEVIYSSTQPNNNILKIEELLI